ncbi:MAG: cryptochrome/photolyase family protein [Alphaproteobacteria bacterium]|nr:cryptochrome/photolyase family protein [Alphaproteobacteria bacterium]
MSSLRLVLGDQLSRSLSALQAIDPADDVVLMAEVSAEATYVPHHKQKIALVFSAMRHFAELLRAEGIRVDYVRLDDPDNSHSLEGEMARAIRRHHPDRLVMTEAGEWRLACAMRQWQQQIDCPLEILPDDRFFIRPTQFAAWAKGRKLLRLEHFYQEMRKRTGILMDGPTPYGGRYNFDVENRKALPRGTVLPQRRRFPPDRITREVIALVDRRFTDHFGRLEGFGWPVTRAQARAALRHFVEDALPQFGAYQDAMATDAPFLFHSLLSPALNLGLLTARELCRAAEEAYLEGQAPLPAVEGFIRQILGWREYVRGVYWLKMPDYAQSNALGASRPLPAFYWDGKTRMRCLAEAVQHTRDHAYSHHIQRLMLTGNFALLAGIEPRAVEDWYLAVYADAYEWVELPNTHGMALYADGGILASKPYAASGAYIKRMSDFCGHCTYDVTAKLGADACPFNYLYWAFLIRKADVLQDNPRLAMAYRTLAGWSAAQKDAYLIAAKRFLDGVA